MPTRPTRRRFLGIAGGAAAAVAIGVPRGVPLGSGGRADGGGRRGPDDPLARLGHAYLRAFPDEESAEVLFEGVPGLRHGRPVAGQLAGLQARITRDFTRQRTVSLDGWRLARTEARVAALHALGR